MILVDTNLLLYAVNRNAPRHAAAAAWLEALFNGDEEVGLPEAVLIGFLRIVTQPRIVPRPMAPAAAVELVETWISLPNVRLLLATPESFQFCLRALREIGVAGKLCTDAQIAGLALTYRATVATVDTDFRRFHGLKLWNPLERT